MKPKKDISIIRSSASEYLTFVAGSGNSDVNAIYAEENVWLSQKMITLLYDVDVRTVNYHLKTIFSDSELEETSVIRNFRITAADGKTFDTILRKTACTRATLTGWSRGLRNDPLSPIIRPSHAAAPRVKRSPIVTLSASIVF